MGWPPIYAIAILIALLYGQGTKDIACDLRPKLSDIGLPKVGPETPESCTQDQFYESSSTKCRNCSDISQLFDSDRDWTRSDGLNNNAAILTPISTSNSLQQDRRPSTQRTSSLAGGGGSGLRSPFRQDDNILSKLIALEPAEKEFADSSSGAGAENLDEDYEESDSQTNADLIKATKQIQRFIARFIRSNFIGQELPNAMDNCRQNQNISACQMWANLCVMTMYSFTDYNKQASLLHLDGYEARKSTRKRWQECPQFSYSSICNSIRDWYRDERRSAQDIQSIYSMEEFWVKIGSSQHFKSNQVIQLLAYKYTYDGQLISIDQFGADDMEKFCLVLNGLPRRQGRDSHIRIGRSEHLLCQFDPLQASQSSIQHFNQTIFIDLYIGFVSNSGTFVKPVPVLIKNLIFNNVQVNRKYAKDSTRWKLVHRFFTHSTFTFDTDNHEMIQSANQADISQGVILYPKLASLDIKLKLEDKGAHISSFLLILDYGQTPRNNTTRPNNKTQDSRPQAVIESYISINQDVPDLYSYKKDLDLTLTIMGILSSVWSLIRCYHIQKCHGVVKLNFKMLIQLYLISCDTLGNLIALVSLTFSMYLFVKFKYQTNVHVMTANEELESALLFNLRLAFVLKSFGLFHKLHTKLSADTFFIDWEKPKMLTSGQMTDYLAQNSRQSNTKLDSIDETIGQSPNFLANQPSFWRVYSIINRWLQIQTTRRENITLQLFLFVCIIDYFHLLGLATTDPSWTILLPETASQMRLKPRLSPLYRVVILSATYLLISSVQVLYSKYMHESMVRNVIHEFVDLCSVANVSLFCMLYPRFGYYIHGRNANGSGDCGIAEINALLEREERDLCSKRGLAPDSDHQVFMLILPRIINDHYKKLLYSNDLLTTNPINNKQTLGLDGTRFQHQNKPVNGNLLRSAFNMSLSTASLSAPGASFGSNRHYIEAKVAKNKAINMFLANFIEHGYKDIDYTIRERKKFESFLFDVDLDDEISTMGGDRHMTNNHDKPTAATFCKDSNTSFTALLWLGLELDLVIIELLALLTLDMWLNKPVIISAILIWLSYQLLKSLYISRSRYNLICKALVDDKFLYR